MAERKLPRLEPETAFYWTAGAEGVLRIQRCTECGTYQHPPFPRCSSCGSEAVAPEAVSGKGRLASYTVNREAWVSGLAVPFVFGVVELAEQAQLYVFTNILADEVRVGMPLTVSFEQHDDVWLPMFREEKA
ncbi:Zn-ribbon domain-containing OB-fold protein [Novosphingobium kaempferiae]|uniref:Zn-ribbon domain-containing OB-fold protein n=1 Tax=Novosphingobium kaempferiae TaxID=2896849 RepID=UPI001E41A9B9|nr:zinc ribbon domain-containing protein [Novosphingobium kaempferiae]